MQFPYPRKLSPPPRGHGPTRSSPFVRRRKLKSLAKYLAGIVAVILFLLWLFPGGKSVEKEEQVIPADAPKVVIVTTLDPQLGQSHRQHVVQNRRDYAARHGYETFFPNTTDYDLMPGVPNTWSTLPAMRHAMAAYPHTAWIWYLSSTSLIMDPAKTLQEHVLNPEKLESLMILDRPIIPPDSIIRSFKHLTPDRVDLIVSQDNTGLGADSFIVRTGEWAKFFLDAWFDPLYRSYNFQKAERHALEHIVQWHGTILARLALVPQRTLNSYTRATGPSGGLYQEGDLVANFHGCLADPERDCEEEMSPFIARWRQLRDQQSR